MKAIFIDIDNTLLDFDAYVRTTMEQGFAHFGLPAYRPEMYHTFTAENNKLWRQIEEGTLTHLRRASKNPLEQCFCRSWHPF